MKPISEVIREKETEMQHVREEIEALLREKELHLKNLDRELETLRAAAKIISEAAEPGGAVAAPQTSAAAASHSASAPQEGFPAQPVPISGPEPARKRWP